MREVVVRYLSLSDIEDGVSGFYEHSTDKRCAEPNKSYTNGRCHTIGAEMDALAEKVGFITRAEYAQKRKTEKYTSWKNAYSCKLSLAVGQALETEEIKLDVNGDHILFQCPEGEFVGWPRRKVK